jgi:exodeoxyribonuclease V beta subunit
MWTHARGHERGAALTTSPLAIDETGLVGTTLVEASAGTGKTWSIAALYVRLVLERWLPVERILVVTFGRAATAELKGRIRDRLVAVGDQLSARTLAELAESEDVLLAHVARTTSDARRAVLWLSLAIESFDRAAVFTVHAFCKRALDDRAFESAAPLEAVLVPDESALVDEVVQDFWRHEIASASPFWASRLVAAGITPAKLARFVERFQNKPYAQVLAPLAPGEEAEAAFVAAHASARALWLAEREAIIAALAHWPQNHLNPRVNALDAYFATAVPSPETPRQLQYFSASKLAEEKRKGRPSHPFFSLAGELWNAAAPLKGQYGAMLARLAEFSRTELARRKRERRLQGYGDLLADLRDALTSPGGKELAAALRECYPAALVDEFQDTDPIQYEIFQRIYGGTDSPIAFVGDAKQAIYSFRGADVNAYLAARDAADAERTLPANFRSIPPLVRAVNAVFAGETPFVTPDISFSPAQAGAKNHAPLVIEGDAGAPFTIWFLSEKRIAEGGAHNCVAEATAAAISHLLAAAERGEATLDGKPLRGDHIAVLVQRHRQGERVRDALARLGIASVTYGQASVFDSAESIEIERVLAAVAEPMREPLVRAALATDLIGKTGDELAALAADSNAWERILQRFTRYHETAIEHGFIRMWRELVEAEGVSARLLGYIDGERRLTNVQHLVDLLQEAAVRDGLDLEGLRRLLARSRGARMGDAETQQLRLESDEHLVRILTVHAAKGLGFPIVFCPFLWEGRRPEEKEVIACHTLDAERRALFDAGSPDFERHAEAAAEEAYAERVRLAYVALTRAAYRCTIAWGCVKGAETSPLAWLLHRPPPAAGTRVLGALKQHFKCLDEARMRADLARLEAASEGAIRVTDLPDDNGIRVAASDASRITRAARAFTGRIPLPWRISSFTGLVARRPSESPDYDALLASAVLAGEASQAGELESPARTIFTFPKGIQAGTLLHALLETVDFQHAESEKARALVRQKLADFGFDAAWSFVLEQMLADVVATPLDPSGTLTLSKIGQRNRISELEFVFPVRSTPHALRAALAPMRAVGSRLPDAMGAAVLAPAHGFLRGFIDLVFEFEGRYYLVDWKSNWLGATYESYAHPALVAAMHESFYDLQYLLYVVALQRHLAGRLPEYDYDAHFGGIYYLFIRGMAAERRPATGVFFVKPERALVQSLDAALAGTAPLPI